MCPIFDFKCTECENVFEKFISCSEGAPKCSDCGAKTEKQVSGCSFAVKGAYNGKMQVKGHEVKKDE
jgi:putative FmdB family regulatory protein